MGCNGYDILRHQLHSTDLVSANYHLFEPSHLSRKRFLGDDTIFADVQGWNKFLYLKFFEHESNASMLTVLRGVEK